MFSRLAALAACCCLLGASAAYAASLATFQIKEPLGQTWTDEWLTRDITVDTGARAVKVSQLQLATGAGNVLPLQCYTGGGKLLRSGDIIKGKVALRLLFRATVKPDETVAFTLTDQGSIPPAWQSVQVDYTAGDAAKRTTVSNGIYTVEFNTAQLLPVNAMRCGGQAMPAAFAWPQGVQPTDVTDVWREKGPAQAILARTFRFANPKHKYEVTFTFRAGDPWIDVADTYALGGGALTLDLTGLQADYVYHEYAYNARTFKPSGPTEDSTLQPPQHPIATLGPIWRDIWYNGGAFAFVYNSNTNRGIGFAAVRGSEWRTPAGITPESQNLHVNGDKQTAGLVKVDFPTDGGTRRWAMILGDPSIRKDMGRLIRSHADIPLEMVLKEWILDWPSRAAMATAEARGGSASQAYLNSHFNTHYFNPTTFPRSVASGLPKQGPVKSRDLAVLAYIFTNPNYWPGPKYQWRIGNPNFHTDMYCIPLRIALLMPDHPHAKRWLEYGINELKGNLMRDSYPGGAWQESLGYSAFYFHVVDYARQLRDSGIINPIKEWPRFKEVATYMACMSTPVDPRYGSRQMAPIGDTHPGNYVKQLQGMADLYRGVDDRFSEQLARFPEKWEGALEIGSRPFPGFGAMLRGNAYDERNESFVTVKAGPARNHYQGDELAFHFCSLGTPLAIDHACHYSPRPWSASMHNRPDMNNQRPVAVAVPLTFAKSAAADVFVAEERTTAINQVPLEPHQTVKPAGEYPTIRLPEDKAWAMRRYTMLVKHDPQTSKLADYLVVRDEISSPQPVWWNLHLLARDIRQQGNSFFFPGQLDVDLTAHFLTTAIGSVEKREWGWKNVNGADLRNTKGEEYEQRYFGAYIPEKFTRGTWGADKAHPEQSGEMTKWLRVQGPAGRSNWLVVLMPNRKGQPAPTVEKLSDTSARITLGQETEVVTLGTEGAFQAAVERNGSRTVLLEKGSVK